MPKRNLYLSDDDVDLWDELPKGERGRILRDLLLERKSKAMLSKSTENIIISDKEKERNKILQQIYELEKKYRNYRDGLKAVEEKINKYDIEHLMIKSNMLDCQREIDSLKLDYNEKIGPLFLSGLWDEIYSAANGMIGEVFNHPLHKEKMWAFRIKSVKNGKIEVERLDMDKKTSSFITRNIAEQVEQKLEDNWDGNQLIRIKSGNLLGDYGVECTIVMLSTKMKHEKESILYEVPSSTMMETEKGFKPNEYREKVADYTIDDCIEAVNRGVGNYGWVPARGRFNQALREKFNEFNYDCSDFLRPDGMSFAKKIRIEGDKIVQFE